MKNNDKVKKELNNMRQKSISKELESVVRKTKDESFVAAYNELRDYNVPLHYKDPKSVKPLTDGCNNRMLTMLMYRMMSNPLSKENLITNIVACSMSENYAQMLYSSVFGQFEDKLELFPGGKFLKTRLDSFFAKNGANIPLSAEGAVLADLQYCKQAYLDMRTPGASIDDINKQLSKARYNIKERFIKSQIGDKYDLSTLTPDDYAKVCKPYIEKYDKVFNQKVMLLSETYPEIKDMFAETAYCGISEKPREVVMKSVQTEHGLEVKKFKRPWDGTYCAVDPISGKQMDMEGTFTVRMPLSRDAIFDRMTTIKTGMVLSRVAGETDFMDKLNHLSDELIRYSEIDNQHDYVTSEAFQVSVYDEVMSKTKEQYAQSMKPNEDDFGPEP